MTDTSGAAVLGAPSPAGQRQRAERRFYSGMALFMGLLVLVGFGPSFYFKFLGLSFPRPNPTLNPLVIFHGVVFTLWTVVFVAQALLVNAGRRDVHRKLGVAGMALAVLMLPVMYVTAAAQVARANQPPFTDPLTWTAVPLLAVAFLAPLLWLGWRHSRRDLQAHKRLMLGAMIMVVQPAIGRLPLAPPTLMGFGILLAISWLLFIPLIQWDRHSLGRVHWATALGASLYAVSLALQQFFLAMPGSWARFAVHLPGIAQ